jgi:hypothetical protein
MGSRVYMGNTMSRPCRQFDVLPSNILIATQIQLGRLQHWYMRRQNRELWAHCIMALSPWLGIIIIILNNYIGKLSFRVRFKIHLTAEPEST